jgi:hypothetical protein
VECRCTEDALAIRFERSGGPVLEVEDEPGLPIEATVILETRSVGVLGWTYGVRHDGRALTIESVTTVGTDAGRFFDGCFNLTRFENILDCKSHPGPGCREPQPGAGFISAVVSAHCGDDSQLPVGTNSLAKAAYRLGSSAVDAGEAGVLLEFTETLALRNSPPTAIRLTILGWSARPRTLVDGHVIVSRRPFHRGDPDGDGRISIADAVSLLLFLFLSGPSPGCLEAGDADDDGRIDTTDPVVILRWLFGSGSPPGPPGPPPAPCGRDPEGSSAGLGCGAYEACTP